MTTFSGRVPDSSDCGGTTLMNRKGPPTDHTNLRVRTMQQAAIYCNIKEENRKSPKTPAGREMFLTELSENARRTIHENLTPHAHDPASALRVPSWKSWGMSSMSVEWLTDGRVASLRA